MAAVVDVVTTPGKVEMSASSSSTPKPTASLKDEIRAIARNFSDDPVQNPDPSVWAVLTAISATSHRRRPQGLESTIEVMIGMDSEGDMHDATETESREEVLYYNDDDDDSGLISDGGVGGDDGFDFAEGESDDSDDRASHRHQDEPLALQLPKQHRIPLTMVSRGLFGWSPPHMQPLTPVSEVSEPPESPSSYMDSGVEASPLDNEGLVDVGEEIEPLPAAGPFLCLFACADRFDWVLMALGAVAAAAHGMALVVYLHYFGKAINLLNSQSLQSALHGDGDKLFNEFKKPLAMLQQQ